MAKNNLHILIKTFLLLFLIIPTAFSQECGKDYSALVFNPENGDILFENQPDQIIYPASLTKLMTVYLAFEAIKDKKLSLEDQLFASPRAVAASKVNKNNRLNLEEGDAVLVRKAIEGAIVKSYNELTVMLAEGVSGSEWQFARNMNAKAKDLKMWSTNFRNASGLHDPGQFTTNEDLAKLVLAIKKDFPEYYHFFSLKEFTYKNIKYPTHNKVLQKYKGVDGMKTGFTKASGFHLITSFNGKQKSLITIVTGCESVQKRDNFTRELLNKALQKPEEYQKLFTINDHKKL